LHRRHGANQVAFVEEDLMVVDPFSLAGKARQFQEAIAAAVESFSGVQKSVC